MGSCSLFWVSAGKPQEFPCWVPTPLIIDTCRSPVKFDTQQHHRQHRLLVALVDSGGFFSCGDTYFGAYWLIHFSNLNDILRISSGKLTAGTWMHGGWGWKLPFPRVICRPRTKATRTVWRKKMGTYWACRSATSPDLRSGPQITNQTSLVLFWHLSILQRKGKNASARNCRSVAHQLELQTPGQARGKREVSQAPWISSNGNKVTNLKEKTDIRSIKGMWEAPFQESTSSLSSLYLATSWHIFFTMYTLSHATPLSAWFQLILIGWQCGNQTSVDLKLQITTPGAFLHVWGMKFMKTHDILVISSLNS